SLHGIPSQHCSTSTYYNLYPCIPQVYITRRTPLSFSRPPETKRLTLLACNLPDSSRFLAVTEADNGAIESSSINHRRVDEEDERTANQTVANDLAAGVTLRARVNDTANETPPAAPTRSTYYYFPLANASQANESGAAELQRDQSDLLSVVAVASSNDVREQDANDPLRSTERSGDPGSKAQPANDDFVASTRPNRAEIASSIVPLESRLPGSRNEDQDLSNVVDREDELEPDSRKREDSIGLTTASTREIVATSVVKPIEQKNAEENVRAISFQVPAVAEEVAEDAVRQRQDNEQARNAMEPRKDHSRPVNNLVLPGGKSTKAFYEIKPSIKTEMEPDQLNPSSTQRPLPGRKFVLPSVDSAFGKFGPYFEDGDQEINVTARIGSTMLLDCKIGMLGNKESTKRFALPRQREFIYFAGCPPVIVVVAFGAPLLSRAVADATREIEWAMS
ncbi:hypothetical protein K0M31_003973, partial [Melipona bicolor]